VLIFTKIEELQAFLKKESNNGKTIGFVPTMGALHVGHSSLIAHAKKQCSLVVCSIFVNPAQFNDPKDLERYPRTPERDKEKLIKAACDVLFIPTVNEVYPNKEQNSFDFGDLDEILEGKFRPGHFNGVAQVVSRLFEIVKPEKAFFGMKDFQQLIIIEKLVEKLKLKIEIIRCPTKREENGLAMSSRNALLNEVEKKEALVLSKALKQTLKLFNAGKSLSEIKKEILTSLQENKNIELEYFEICNPTNLQNVESFEENKQYIALVACFIGKIRLIDNIILSH
jgi:pantoate--beta-alanine ligase